MTKQETRAWIIVGVLFLMLMLVVGSAFGPAGVFLPPLAKQFGWSRTQISAFQSALAVAAGITGPIIGWLLDRIDAKKIGVLGAIIAAIGFLVASQASSYSVLLVAYMLAGIGEATAGFPVATLVVANWFGAGRGLAMGIVIAGSSVGAAVMTTLGNMAISHGGWRAGYLALAIPMLLIVVPLVAVFVRSRPESPSGETFSAAEHTANLPGAEFSEALRWRSLWLICFAQFVNAVLVVAMIEHLVPYILGLGYGRSSAVEITSIYFLVCACTPVAGFLADRFSSRWVLSVVFVCAATSMALALGASSGAIMVLFVVLGGIGNGGPLVLIPLIIADTFGLKRFGSIFGINAIFFMVGSAVGPLVAGRIFDATGSYSMAFEIFIALGLLAAVATINTRRFIFDQGRIRTSVAPAVSA